MKSHSFVRRNREEFIKDFMTMDVKSGPSSGAPPALPARSACKDVPPPPHTHTLTPRTQVNPPPPPPHAMRKTLPRRSVSRV